MICWSKKTIAVSTAALLIAGGTSALAWWTVVGGGQGHGTVSTAQPVQYRGDVPPLWPGTPVTLPVEYQNPNPGTVHVQGLDANFTGFTEACPATNFDLPPSYPDYLTLPATGDAWAPLPEPPAPLTVTLHEEAPEECQGLALTVDYVSPAAAPTPTPTPTPAP